MGDPQVTMAFNTKMTWIIFGVTVPHDFENLHINTKVADSVRQLLWALVMFILIMCPGGLTRRYMSEFG